MFRKSRTSTAVDPVVLDDTGVHGLDVSLIEEQAPAAAVRAEAVRRWERENAGALAERAGLIGTDCPSRTFRSGSPEDHRVPQHGRRLHLVKIVK